MFTVEIMSKIVEVNDLKVQFKSKVGGVFGHHVTKEILHGVSFDMEEGQIVGLVGESGSGKSTIAKAILSLIPYTGEIKTMEEAYPSMIFQDPYSSLNPAKKVGWLLEEALYLDGVKEEAERKKKASKMINLVGLSDDYLTRYPKELSGGQRQRVCIALALMQEPKLLIADEPVSALDVTIQAQILELLKNLQKTLGLSILFISHDLRVVYNLCDKVMILKNGEIVEQGPPKEVYANPQHPYTKELLLSI